MTESPTEFELVTCIAMEYFVRRGCQIVVMEVGMGGELERELDASLFIACAFLRA